MNLFQRLKSATLVVALALSSAGALLATPAARAQTASSPQPLVSGAAVGPLSASSGTRTYYAFDVPAGSTQASFAITGSSGDADIYVRYGAVPTLSTWNYRPYTKTSNETVNVSNPSAGTWYVMVNAHKAYDGLTLKAQHNGSAVATTSTPSLNPAPGTYSGQVSVVLSTSTPNAVIRFTTNGSEPSASSEVYAAPIIVAATTQVRAIAFAQGYAQSTVASGTYTIQGALVVLSNGVAITNLSGAKGSVANYKLAVPAGVSSVTFSIAGGTGDADLYVKYGQLATTSVWDQRPYLSGNNETITLNTPQAGDYFLMLHGYSAYSGVTLKAATSGTATAGKPDLMVWAGAMNPYVTTETFAVSSCDVAEGTITAGTKRLLRFATQSRNVGTADLALGNPATNPAFEWASCHGHYHFKSFAQYRLLDSAGSMVRTGRKVGFCLMDITRVDPAANPSARYNCSNQGIQAGWADVYSANLSGQWIDITGLPAGQYVLEVTMDPMNLVDEADETNNTTRVNVTVN